MNLEEHYLAAFHALKEALKTSALSPKEAIALIDLTLLDEEASDLALLNLSEKANHHQVAALCVLPKHLQQIKLSQGIQLATVLNFPEGNQRTQEVLATLDSLLTHSKVDEIDYVFPHQTYLEGEKQFALSQCQQAYELCQQQDVIFKVILETGALLSLELIYQLSQEVMHGGCDFLKTSTGKIAQGATLSAAFTMLKAIADNQANCGLKISGGIKKKEQAWPYMVLAQQMGRRDLHKSWFRIGASSLLDELIKQH